MAENKENIKKNEDVKVNKNFFVYIVIGLIIVTFVISTGVVPGIIDFVSEIGKKTEKNPDGTISIERMAQIPANQKNPDAYIGKVLGKKIQFGRDDNFNRQYENIINNPNIQGYQKYQYIGMIFNNEIEKIIGMYNAERMGITVSNRSVLKLIAKRSYVDQNGEINYDALKKDLNKINMNQSESVKAELLLDNYEYDFFGNFPVSKDEVSYQYALDNSKVKIKYFDVKLDNVPLDKLDQYLKLNDDKYKQYKISKIIFSESNKKDAETALVDLINAPDKFAEVGNKLKSESKAINVINDTEYYFSDNYDIETADIVKATKIGSICNKIVSSKNIGYMVIKLEDVRSADITDSVVLNRVKADFVNQNRSVAELDAQKKSDDIYKMLVDGVDLERVSVVSGVKLDKPDAEYGLSDNIFPVLNADSTDDMGFTVSLFGADAKTALKPYKYANGYIVVYVEDKKNPDSQLFDSSYAQLSKKVSSTKSSEVKYDFYRSEKKKHKVVDNFKYVFKIQDFLDLKGN